MYRLLAFAIALLLVPVAAHARCPARATAASFLAPEFGVGVRTLMLEDTSRPTPPHLRLPGAPTRKLVTEVWYPADVDPGEPVRDAPLARGRHFPVIVNSHGFFDFRTGEAYYAEHLASRGFVVASPDFPLTNIGTPGGAYLGDLANQPGDVSFIIDEILRRGRTPGEWLHRGLNPQRIGVTGLSFGGATTLLVTYHPTLRDPRVRAALPIAPAGCLFGEAFYREVRPHLLVLQGDQDLILPLATNGARVFERADSPRTLVTLIHGTHTAFNGFFVMPDPVSYDRIACMVLADVEQRGDPLEGLGGAENGIDATGCALPCLDPLPPNAPMPGSRQHELTKLVGTVFFESTLNDSRVARCFLRVRLGSQNADLVVTRARKR